MQPRDPVEILGYLRDDQRVLVRRGEVLVACGADVVLESEPLEEGGVLALLDAQARVGTLYVTEALREPALGAEIDSVLPDLADSLERTGARRGRLRVLAAGDVGWLGVVSQTMRERESRRPRRRARGAVLLARLDVGAGRFEIEFA